jgi:aspartyl protease family protein
VIEVEGARRSLARGQHYSTGASDARQSVTLAADTRGHFITDGAINGNPVRFLVDTGATMVALPAAEAVRLGIDYRKGQPGLSATAGGMVTTYRVKLDSVRLGAIEISGVDGVVLEQGLDITLLGMSFLNRIEMKRDGHTMVLIRRF